MVDLYSCPGLPVVTPTFTGQNQANLIAHGKSHKFK